jgi:hypothetical protein
MKKVLSIFIFLFIFTSTKTIATTLDCKSNDDETFFQIFFDNKNLVSISSKFPFGRKFLEFLTEDDIYLVYQDTPIESLYDDDVKFSNLIKLNKNTGELSRNLRIKEVSETKQNPSLKFKKDAVSFKWVSTEKDFKYLCK